MSAKTLFQRIIDREIPAKIAHEDDETFAFHDISPQAPVHVLIIPKRPIPSVDAVLPEHAAELGRLFVVARKLAVELGLADGYRLVVNCGRDGGQSVDHLHMHLLGGRPLTWPPG
jgi:histidine triad (HIT) family protein